MAIKLYVASDNLVIIDKVTDPLTGVTDISDATVTFTLYLSNGSTVVTSGAAAWNVTAKAYVALIDDAVALTDGTTYIIEAVIVKGTYKRTKFITCLGVKN